MLLLESLLIFYISFTIYRGLSNFLYKQKRLRILSKVNFFLVKYSFKVYKKGTDILLTEGVDHIRLGTLKDVFDCHDEVTELIQPGEAITLRMINNSGEEVETDVFHNLESITFMPRESYLSIQEQYPDSLLLTTKESKKILNKLL